MPNDDFCQDFPAMLVRDDGGNSDFVHIDAYLNVRGSISIATDSDTWIEMSPLVAKAFIERLRGAVGSSLLELLGPVKQDLQL